MGLHLPLVLTDSKWLTVQERQSNFIQLWMPIEPSLFLQSTMIIENRAGNSTWPHTNLKLLLHYTEKWYGQNITSISSMHECILKGAVVIILLLINNLITHNGQDGTSQWQGQSLGWFLSLVHHLLEYERMHFPLQLRKNSCHPCGIQIPQPMDMDVHNLHVYYKSTINLSMQHVTKNGVLGARLVATHCRWIL